MTIGAVQNAELTVRTFGHGTLESATFTSLLDGASIDCVVDVRSFPSSRHNPQYGKQAMENWAQAANIIYQWMPQLGGRRRAIVGSRNVGLRHVSFRAYADYMETPEFHAGVESLLMLANSRPTTVMCSESVWWRCHRRLISDYLVLVEGVKIEHLLHDGRLAPHILTDAVRLDNGGLIYDVGTTPPLPSI